MIKFNNKICLPLMIFVLLISLAGCAGNASENKVTDQNVDVAPAQQPMISTPLFFHSYQRLSDRMRRKAFDAA